MSHVAARRLIDAADTLHPADRALLNIWVNRGLDDAAVARMTGMSVQATARRRARIVERLGTEAASPRTRRLWSSLALVVAVVGVVVVVALASSGYGHQRPAAAAHQRVASTSSISRRSSASAGRPTAEPLVALPGGPKPSSGAITVIRAGSRLKLNVRISNLPALSHAHYEVWLYDSLVNSEALGRLRTGVTQLSLRLPENARRYQWIDISVQPGGAVFHSGGSVLRSVNPLLATAAGHHS